MRARSLRTLSSRLASSRLPRRTVRLRLTALYGGLFLACGAGLLAITYVLFEHALPDSYTTVGDSHGGYGVVGTGSSQPPAGSQLHVTAGGKPLSAAQTELLGRRLRQLAAQQRAHDLHHLLTGSAIALAIMAVLAVGLGWLVAGRILRPLRTITDATRRISEQNLHERLSLPGPNDELKTLGDTIDALLARLENAFDAQRLFVANASHELRTPLTMMRTTIDVATAKPGPPRPDIDALAARIELGLDKADRLVEGFLALAQAQHATADPSDQTSIADVVSTVLAERRDSIAAAGITVEHFGGPALARAGELLVTRLVVNLIDNAIRHNQPDGWIRITTTSNTDSAVLVVENSGPQLDQSEVDQLHQPFRRVNQDRTHAPGFGLGLSIVAAIVTNYAGTLDLQARIEGGLRVIVTLPYASQPSAKQALARSGR